MGKLKAYFIVNGNRTEANPVGLTKAQFVTEREENLWFFRTKMEGGLTFIKEDFALLKRLEDISCCQEVVLEVNRVCPEGYERYWSGVFSVKDLEWDLDTCKASISTVRPFDAYNCIYENWEKQINTLEVAAGRSVSSRHRRGGAVTSTFRGRNFLQVIHYVCLKMLQGTACESTIPASENDLGVFLNAPMNPITQRQRKYLSWIQASDVLNFNATQSAIKGEISFKELTEELYNLFKLAWFVNPQTGKIQFEHESYFEGLSYTPTPVGLDLTEEKYKEYVRGKRTYSYKTDEIYGEYILKSAPNESLGKDFTLSEPGATNNNIFFSFPTINDFQYGNIKFDQKCIKRDTKGVPEVKEISVKRIATDIYIANLTALPNNEDGRFDLKNWFFLVECDDNGLITEALGERSNVIIENGNFTMTSLVRDYHSFNQSFGYGRMNYDTVFKPNGFNRPMATVLRSKILKEITIPYCCDDERIMLNRLVENWMCSNGLIERAVYKPTQDSLTLQLSCQPNCGVTSGDPSGPQDPECPPRGEFIRYDEGIDYCPDGTIMTIWHLNVYTDGKCGEFTISENQGVKNC